MSARVVWSSDGGRTCPGCHRPTDACACRDREASRVRGDGRVRVRREVSGRRGKAVTAVRGVPLDDAGLRDVAASLKRRCGSGGTVKDGVIEIQGDHVETVVHELRARGYDVRRAGG